ncbi:hypothetical protein SLS64_010230 [Diaporthe eres]
MHYWANFRGTVKKHWCNFFEYHRRGLSRDRRKPWDDENIPPIWTEPAETSWDGRYPTDVQPALDLQAQNRTGYERYSGSGGSARRRKRGDAEAGAEAVRDRLARQGIAVRLAKVLGWGGNGVASLFEVWPGGEDAPSKKVVVKSLLRRGLGMDLEWFYNLALRRARHIIQARFWAREIIPTADEIQDAWQPIDDDRTMLTLEFMKNGDMHHLIARLARTNVSVPQPILWPTVPYPPVAMGPLNDPAGAHLFDSAARVRDSRGNPLPSFYTHGYNLASEPGLDEDFLHLLLRCLADMPVDRPSLWELNWVMTNKERSPGWANPENDPDGIRAWCDRMFRDPPDPPASAAEASTALAPEVFATAMQQPQAPGNDRVPGDQGDDGDDDDMDDGGDTVIPETVL